MSFQNSNSDVRLFFILVWQPVKSCPYSCRNCMPTYIFMFLEIEAQLLLWLIHILYYAFQKNTNYFHCTHSPNWRNQIVEKIMMSGLIGVLRGVRWNRPSSKENDWMLHTNKSQWSSFEGQPTGLMHWLESKINYC